MTSSQNTIKTSKQALKTWEMQRPSSIINGSLVDLTEIGLMQKLTEFNNIDIIFK